jgi:hypothetical protein
MINKGVPNDSGIGYTGCLVNDLSFRVQAVATKMAAAFYSSIFIAFLQKRTTS